MIQESDLRIGITTRITNAVGYDEKRDSLAHDWSRYFISQFPNSSWLSIPNIESDAIGFMEKWNINAIILSGGEDIGESKKRDNTEFKLIEYAQRNSFPVLGVCRGLQVLYSFFGGRIEKGTNDFVQVHKAKRHNIFIGGGMQEVNSYHQNILVEDSCPTNLSILSRCANDYTIESVSGNGILGIMWHPERELLAHQWNTDHIKDFFLHGNLKLKEEQK